VFDLDRAGVKPAGARAVEILRGAPFDDDDIGAGQGELGRQHHARRTATGDHHGMLSRRICSHRHLLRYVLGAGSTTSGRHSQHDPVACGKTPSSRYDLPGGERGVGEWPRPFGRTGGHHVIGPTDERWDLVTSIKQASVAPTDEADRSPLRSPPGNTGGT
jgi:hypothetical protein